MSSEELRGRVRQVLAEHGKLAVDAAGLGDDDDLYAAGMTSHASVGVMLALEGAFDLEFPDRLLRRSSFQSVAAIAAAITEIQGGA
ncbi:MAG: acyl carrier protein [Kofleriaceae bacterium]